MNHTLLSFSLVAIGGSTGACFRYFLSLILRNHALNLPLGTVVANFVGCLIIGILAGMDFRLPGLSSELRLLFATGFCGGLTTMSSFIYETSKLTSSGEYLLSTIYVTLTLAGSSLCFALGFYIVKLITRTL